LQGKQEQEEKRKTSGGEWQWGGGVEGGETNRFQACKIVNAGASVRVKWGTGSGMQKEVLKFKSKRTIIPGNGGNWEEIKRAKVRGKEEVSRCWEVKPGLKKAGGGGWGGAKTVRVHL